MGATSSTRRSTTAGGAEQGRAATVRAAKVRAAGAPAKGRTAEGGTVDSDTVPANVVVLCGRLSSAPQWRELASGSVLWTLEVTTQGDRGAASVPVAWFDPAVEPSFETGDEVYVVGEVRRRFFRGANGTQSRTEVVATEVWRTSQRAKVRASVGRLAAVMGRAGGRGLRSP